jgi:hypothetical protein
VSETVPDVVSALNSSTYRNEPFWYGSLGSPNQGLTLSVDLFCP